MNNKSKQREYLKQLRNSIDVDVRRNKSLNIAEKLISSEEYKSAGTVMTYMSFGNEVETDVIFESILCSKKRLAVPLCNPKDGTMQGYYICGKSFLELGSYGIYEPKRDMISNGELIAADKSEIDLIIVPGLGFDKEGYRIGYGKGYYDRYLDGFDGITVGLCFNECMLDCIFRDKHDKKIDMIINDSGEYKIDK